MKFAALVGCLVVGIAIGWVAHPLAAPSNGANSSASLPAAGSSSASDPATSRPERTLREDAPVSSRKTTARVVLEKTHPDKAAEESMKEAQKRAMDQVTGMQRKKFESRLAKLAAQLHLTDAQQQQIRDAMEKRFASYADLLGDSMAGKSKDPAEMAKLGELMKSDGLDDALKSTLQGEQLDQYNEVKVKEKKTRADAKALKDLSSLSVVVDDLTQDQRDAIYQAYNERAMNAADKPAGFMQMYEDMGVQMDDELGLQDLMGGDMMEFAADSDAPKKMQDRMKDRIQKQVEDRLATLAPHLTAAQLQQYRSHLEEKAANLTGMFGMGGAEEGPAVVIPGDDE